MGRSAKNLVVEQLRDKIQQLERSRRRASKELVCSTGCIELDRLLPEEGLAAGTLTEWLSEKEGTGAMALALFLAGRLQEQGGAVVVIEESREFYPPAARALG